VGPFNEYKPGKLEGPAWLAKQKANNHTIQLQTFTSKQEIFAFIEDEGYYLKQSLAYYPVKKANKISYVLLYGSFEKISQADQAMYNLPYKLSDESNGIVSMKDVQSTLL